MGVCVGMGTASFKEFADTSVRSAEQLTSATSYPVLAIIPVIHTPDDANRRRVKKAVVLAGFLLLLAGSLVYFHYQVMDLRIFWANLIGRIFI